MTDFNVIPVILGADLNCYNVARAFHEEYGLTSHAFGRMSIGASRHSKFIKYHEIKHFNNPDILVQVLRDFADKYPDHALIVIGCTDDYAVQIIKNKPLLEDRYIIPSIDAPLMETLVNKEYFYLMCDKYNLPYPKTYILRTGFSDEELSPQNIGFAYPVIVKPSSSIEYWKHPFALMKKVYTADTQEQAASISREIFASGYGDSIIVQDFIPGDDSNMRVLSAYSDKNSKVKMMCLGHVLLEEHTPTALGNHAAIITESIPSLCEKFRAMLDDIGYRGFSNFDIKYDPRDNTMRVFEINLRQGRSNFYITGAGINIARLLVEDYVFNNDLPYSETTEEFFWSSVPRGVVYKYVSDENLRDKVRSLCKSGRASHSYWYKYDLRLNFLRYIFVVENMRRHYSKYKKYSK